MAVTATSTEKTVSRGGTTTTVRPRGPNGSRGPNGGPGRNGGGGDERQQPDPSHASYRLGMWVALASVVMLFTALTSAYVVRLGWSSDWRPTAVPSFLWLSTALIVGSSWTVERARREERKGETSGARRWLFVTLLVGLGFVATQLLAWRQLVAQGVYLKSNPHSSFFYVLTALHGLHVLGGIAGLNFLLLRQSPRGGETEDGRVRRRSALDAVTLYWHFMDGLWIYLFLLLFLWR
ncbi:MAG TPA: cytochrome c oxidase subunit 3 [Pyrinomonadaceae bacterium]|nr:cytochrome c oxidase subunit 3 [Pyrinomonadaceae bacterium]